MPPLASNEFNTKALDELTTEQKQNYNILVDIMTKYGFTTYEEEWYHFDYKDWEKYQLLNYQFAQLYQLSR